MKTIGLIGGLTWYSTLDYYRLLNELVNKELGGSHAAKIILNSVDFAEIKVLTEEQDWDGLAVIMSEAAKSIERAGADCVMIGANTMHKIADEVQAIINIPIIHIADAVANVIKQKGLKVKYILLILAICEQKVYMFLLQVKRLLSTRLLWVKIVFFYKRLHKLKMVVYQ